LSLPAFELAAELQPRVRVGLLALEGLQVAESGEALAGEIDACAAELRARHAGRASGEVPGVERARSLYKSLGLDPTKTRPSNEALLRRVLKGEALYRINTLVDALNLCSLRAQLPYGLYDLDRLEPPLTLRRGGPGEAYEGIRKGSVGVEGRPVLADARGAFGNPSSDSARTMITTATTRALVVVYAPRAIEAKQLAAALDDLERTLVRHCGGGVAGRTTL
jgi:DNA/RNA-binding domain of Phe-tRNA-synthetase-like protein